MHFQRKLLLYIFIVVLLSQKSFAEKVFGTDSAAVSNEYFVMNVGSNFNYAGYNLYDGITLSFTAEGVEEIDGTKCLRIRRKLSNDFDNVLWLAQDEDENIWQLRKYDAHPLGGYDEQDTIYTPANPYVGMEFEYQGDNYTIISLNETVSTPSGTYTNCMHYRADYDGYLEDTYLAPWLGVVKIDYPNDDFSGIHLINTSGVPSVPDTSIWRKSMPEGNGWLYLDWFGRFVELNADWIYSDLLGFIFPDGNTRGSFYYYSISEQAWYWTSAQIFPIRFKVGANPIWEW